jgi:hypothetical protein
MLNKINNLILNNNASKEFQITMMDQLRAMETIINTYAKPMELITKIVPIKEELEFLMKNY